MRKRRGEKINDLDISEPPGKPYYTQATHECQQKNFSLVDQAGQREYIYECHVLLYRRYHSLKLFVSSKLCNLIKVHYF